MKLLFWILLLLLSGTACTSKPKLSPEETVQMWQSYIDKNEFDRARELSTEEALDYVNELASYNTGTDTLPWENNVLLNLKCQIMGDSAVCTYDFEDELGEPLPGQLALRRIKGNWFVCRTNFDNLLPADTLRPGDENLVFPTDSLDEELE
ncbi:MAG: hypothetical protein OHK0019_25500 [Saprospiraceae bacterium]